MRKGYIIPIIVILLAVSGIVGIAKTFQGPAASADSTAATLIISHPVLRPGDRTSIGVWLPDSAQGSVMYAWTAESGMLSAIHVNPVIWTAPESEGRYEIAVEVSDAAGGKSKGSTEIIVTKYPANPLVMSVEPAGRRTAK